MLDETIVDELEDRGFRVKLVFSSTQECTKVVVEEDHYRYFVKCYPLKEMFRTSTQKKLINNELSMAENFKKWNMATCVQFVKRFYTKSTLFMFYTYYKHVTLDSLLLQKSLTNNQRILLFKDLLSLLYELRSAGVLHRHLSPDKILVANSMLKFSGIKYCTEVTRALYETDEYLYLQKHKTHLYAIAPEVLLNQFTGYKTQIFSFGILVYLITHKAYPFGNNNMQQLKQLYVDDVFKPNISNELSEELYYMLSNSLQINYNNRMALSEIKIAVGNMYKSIVHEEETLRQKTYSVMHPKIKIDDLPPSRTLLKEQLFGYKAKMMGVQLAKKLPRLQKKVIPKLGGALSKLMEDRSQHQGSQNESQIPEQSGSIVFRKNESYLSHVSNRAEQIRLKPLSLSHKTLSIRRSDTPTSIVAAFCFFNNLLF
jgi:serine/threonine protein kinase